MLKQRIFTALILIPLFVVLVLSLAPKHFAVLTGVIVLWCAFEWSSLMGFSGFPRNILYPFIIAFSMVGILYLFSNQMISVPQILSITLGWWLVAAVLVFFYPRASTFWGHSKLLRGLMGVMTLIPCWVALNFIRQFHQGEYVILFLFVLIWGADSGAYFVGKLSGGKHKMIPEVSPGKSWEGLAGALVTTLIIVAIAVYLFHIPQWLPFVCLALVTVLFSVLGDLFESMLKRKAGVKDSGRLLPGHGGILDRIDSLTAAAPIFALGIVWAITLL